MDRMKIKTKPLLSYSVVFPNRNDKIEDLILHIPSAKAIEFLSYYLSKRINLLFGQHDFDIWARWLMVTRNDVKTPIGHYAQKNNLANYALIDPYAMLLLISRLLSAYNGRNEEMSQDDISNLFLSYMICCDERIELCKIRPNEINSVEDFVKTFLPNALLTNDIEFPRDYRIMLIKCYCLLIEFPKSNKRFASYLDVFCREKGLHIAKTYLDQLFQVFLELSSKGDYSTSLMEVNPVCRDTIQFLDGFSIDTEDYQHDMDFKMIREKPILKTGLHRYNFIFMKMFLDKAYTGFVFDMKDVLVKHGLLNEQEGYGKLKSMLGEDFSERFLFYSLMKRCFGKHYVNYSGESMQNRLGVGMPDYYLRRGNRFFLFECKDAQLSSNKKMSGDYTVVKDAIYEKYVRNSKGHGKGVTQLANVISNKLTDIFCKLDVTVPTGVKYIFPIIVYFDDSFDVEGPSYLLNIEYKKIIRSNNYAKDYVMKDLVMINIELLMMLENFFADDKLKLANLINSYMEFKKQKEQNQVFPFNKYLFQEARKKGYELKKTRWFDEVYQNLITLDKQGIK